MNALASHAAASVQCLSGLQGSIRARLGPPESVGWMVKPSTGDWRPALDERLRISSALGGAMTHGHGGVINAQTPAMLTV